MRVVWIKTMTQLDTATPPALARPKVTAAWFQVSTMTLWRWAQQPGFPQPLRNKQTVLYSIAAITAWLEGGDA